MSMQLFVPITKVDVEKREVWGRAVQEEPDKAEEVFDYESSKPLFQAWSSEFEKATEGTGQETSLGNIRAMHGKVAAGKVIAIGFNDAEKAIDVGTKIIDDGEWEKCKSGVYTGFSIGGSYAKRWKNGALVRYTAKPSEISIVDNPCVPSARFALVKADGTEERAFKASEAGSDDAASDPAATDDAEKVAPIDPRADEPAEKVAARSDTSAKEGESKYGDVAFADAKNKKYPIDTPEHIRAAWNYINKPKNTEKYSAADVKTIKAKIVAAWKSKIDKDGPPSAKKAETTDTLRKSLYSVSDFAMAISTLANVASCAEFEAAYERDGSEMPAKLRAWLAAGAALLVAMADEETKEMLAALEPAGGQPAMALSAPDGDLAKADAADALQKLIDRTAALEKLEDETADATSALEKLAADVATLTAEREQLTKRIADLEAEPAPAKGVVKAVVFDKADDATPIPAADDADAPIDPNDPDAAEKAALAEMKKALRTPQLLKR